MRARRRCPRCTRARATCTCLRTRTGTRSPTGCISCSSTAMADSTRSRRDESSGGAKARRCVYLTVYDRLRRVSAMLSITFTYGSRLNQARPRHECTSLRPKECTSRAETVPARCGPAGSGSPGLQRAPCRCALAAPQSVACGRVEERRALTRSVTSSS